jgi:predicted ATP-binding protein involved in virulence
MVGLNIQKLTLRDYRCFEHLEIDFDPRLTVLVATNGAGKTSILDAVAIAFGPYVGAFDESVGKHFSPSDIRVSRVRQTVTNEMEYAPKGVSLEAEGHLPYDPNKKILAKLFPHINASPNFQEKIPVSYPIKWKRSLSGPKKVRTSIKDARELIQYGKWLQTEIRTPGSDAILPLLAYYGTGRLWQQKKLTENKKKRTSRTVGYTDSLDPASSYTALGETFRYWYVNSSHERIKALEAGRPHQATEFDSFIASVRDPVNHCLRPVGWHSLSYSLSWEDLVARHDQQGDLPVDWLSDGIRNMIAMVADIAFRATKLNPQFGADAALQTPGIVLIDEVDMHLHPAWQQTVLQNLMEAFPRVQFIVTTHSPQVLTTVPSECIRILSVETPPATKSVVASARKVSEQTLGVASADILARIMGVDTIPDVPEAGWVSDYHALIQQNLHEQPAGIALREKLISHFGPQHPVMLECDRMIRLQQFKQRLPRNLGTAEH